MPRRPRLQFPGAVYHVMSRGNRKSPIFDDDHDRRLFLTTLESASERYEIRCAAFCLMGNHYHLVLETPRGNLADAMRQINGVFAQASNRRHERTGHLFEGRYRSLVIDREGYLRRACRYVVLNPVRSQIVHTAAAWPWSSYRATAGMEPAPRFLQTDWIQWAFHASSEDEARRRYGLYVNDCSARKDRQNIDLPGLGSPAFEAALRRKAGADDSDRPLPRNCRALARPALEVLFRPNNPSLSVRNETIRTAHVLYGYRLAEIAAFLRLDPSTPTVILRKLGPPI
jgi:putative transposase